MAADARGASDAGARPSLAVASGGVGAASADAPVATGGDLEPAHVPGGWPAPLRGARAAFVFFSRLPVGGFPYRASDWHWAPAHLPLVGAVVGAGAAAVFALGAGLGLGPLLRAVLALAASVWLTGALHEDGLADSADGLGGGSDRERVLAIMKDSRIGTYGAAVLSLTLLARAAALSELPLRAWFAIVAVHAGARVVPVWLLGALPYVNDRTDAKSQGLFRPRALHGAVALAWSMLFALVGVALGGLPLRAALAAVLAPLVLVPLVARYFRQRVGGVTGDLLGAAEQLAEVAAWVAITASLAA
ncbi:MAG TPA: adenosylcobinamide-GDP ribazoletransferase [Polyangiaceae bacterium]|nr:adenosylcobinamide-GDP ribazoletransferase [Polyangiaceae bacterium]